MRPRLLIALVAVLAVLTPASSGAPVPFKAVLKAPATQPKVDVKWPYSIKVTDLKGNAIRATVTAVVLDPLGTAHVMDYGPTGPPKDARLATALGGLTLRWTVKAKIGGKTYKKILKRLVKVQ